MLSGNPSPLNVEVHYSSDLQLTDDALRLVRFDVESVSQVISSRHAADPDLWLARPEGYLTDGHLLRDSEAIRLVAYSSAARVIYATDGCNACRHTLEKPLSKMSDEELETLSSRTQLPYSMVSRLAGLAVHL